MQMQRDFYLLTYVVANRPGRANELGGAGRTVLERSGGEDGVNGGSRGGVGRGD